jgi:hypothetical protein
MEEETNTDPRDVLKSLFNETDIELSTNEERNIREMLYTAGESGQFLNDGLDWNDFVRAIQIYTIARQNGDRVMAEIRL